MTLSPGTYKITNLKSKTAVDLKGSDNKSLIGYPPHDGENQRWILSTLGSGWLIKSVKSGKYLTTEGSPKNGMQIVANDFPVTWAIELGGKEEGNIFRIDWPNSPFAIDLEQGSAKGGAKIQLWERNNSSDNRKWIFERCEDPEPEVTTANTSSTTTTIVTTTITTTTSVQTV